MTTRLDRLGDRRTLAAGQPLLLDGGLATTLEAAGHRPGGALWSARLLEDAPDAVAAAHRAFLEAGAEIVTSAGYQLAARTLAADGRDPRRAEELTRHSIALARRAIDAHASATAGASANGYPDPPLVAASIGAYGALLTDGSEYRGRYGVTQDALVDVHAPRVAAAVAAGADVLACETIPAAVEVAALARVLAEVATPAWVSVTPDASGTRTPEGTPLAEALAPVVDVATVVAVGVNCCPPQLVTAALDALRPLGLPVVVAPGLGARWDRAARRWVDDGEHWDRAEVRAWRAAGAAVIGGCCGTTPAEIATLRAVLDATPG